MINKLINKIHNFLRWSEKYTKTDMVYLAKGGSWLTFRQIISSASVFFLSLIFANYLSPDTYGIYKYVLSLGILISAASLSGLGVALSRSASHNQDLSLKIAFRENLVWSIPSCLLSLGMSIYYYLMGNNTLAVSLIFIAILSPLSNSGQLYNAFLQGKKDFKNSSIFDAIGAGVNFIALVIALILTSNPLGIIFAYFFSSAIYNLIIYLYIRRTYQLNNVSDPNLISYSKHLSVMSILSIVATQIDKIFVFQQLGAVDLAIYTFAIAIPEQIKGLLKIFPSLAFPKFTNRSIKEIQKTILPKLFQFVLLTIVISLIFMVASPYIYQFFFPRYLASVPYSIIFGLSLFTAASTISVTVLKAHQAQKELYINTIVSYTSQIIIVFLAVYFWGLWGAIIGTMISRLIALIIPTILIYTIKTKE